MPPSRPQVRWWQAVRSPRGTGNHGNTCGGSEANCDAGTTYGFSCFIYNRTGKFSNNGGCRAELNGNRRAK